jgi:hypothetical protein
MNYERIEYAIRKGLGQDQWVVLIYFPDRADPTAVKFSGPRDDVDAVAPRRIDNWLKRNGPGRQ